MSSVSTSDAPRGRPWLAATAAFALIALALAASNLQLRREAAQAEEAIQNAEERLAAVERAGEARREEAEAAAVRSETARGEVEAALAHAAHAAREASSADELAAEMRRTAVGADERADVAEAELAEARRRLAVLMARLETAEEAAGEARVQADLAGQAAARSKADAAAARAELKRDRESHKAGLLEARGAVAEAMRRQQRAVAIGRQAEAAVQHAFRDFYDPADSGRQPLSDYRTLKQRAATNADRARKELEQAADRIEALLGAL